ncbi:MAG: hypothetical protein KME20_07310 [Kaiparowitsia implicata GSE-PSE-MK54-09C]|nr:hypothetical protein [Kaiparowitsia implicata GSE-PSE-MK54-09C]
MTTLLQAPTDAALRQNGSLHDVVDHIVASRQITRADQRRLMSAALAAGDFTLEDQQLVEQIFAGLRRGTFKVVD